MSISQDNLNDALVQLLADSGGVESNRAILVRLLNHAMKKQREHYLGSHRYQRTPHLRGRANGY